MAKPEVRGVRFLFLVGGFAESPMLQKAVQRALGRSCRIIIPHDVGLTILKGAVLFGLDPTVVSFKGFLMNGESNTLFQSLSNLFRPRTTKPLNAHEPPDSK